MKNFLFKSSLEKTDLYKIFTQLDMLLKEQRAQRIDLSRILKYLKNMTLDLTSVTTEEDNGPSDTEHGE